MLADFIFIDSQGNFTCSFYNYTVAAKSFDDLKIVLPRPKRPRRQFFSRYVKERFRILDIQTTIVLFSNNLFTTRSVDSSCDYFSFSCFLDGILFAPSSRHSILSLLFLV
jgi:hypothetical protein